MIKADETGVEHGLLRLFDDEAVSPCSHRMENEFDVGGRVFVPLNRLPLCLLRAMDIVPPLSGLPGCFPCTHQRFDGELCPLIKTTQPD